MEIRKGQISEIEKFNLFSEENEGEEVTVAVDGGEVVGYVQHTGSQIFFMESAKSGAGRALVDWFKANNDYVVAVNCVSSAVGFYEKMNFQKVAKTSNMDWHEGDDN